MSGVPQRTPAPNWEALGLSRLDYEWTFEQGASDIIGSVPGILDAPNCRCVADIVLDENGDIVPTSSPTYDTTIAGWARKAIT